MQSIEQQLQEIKNRTRHIRRKNRLQQFMALESAALAVCVVLIAAVVSVLPSLSAAGEEAAHRYGSLILAVPRMGYIVIGVLAFIAGILAAVLCMHWKRTRKKDSGENDS